MPNSLMDEENTMVAVDKTMLETTMKSSTVSSTASKPLNNNKNLKWRWNKIKGKIKNKNSYDSNISIATGDTETMNTKTTIDDDEELSSRHSMTNDASFCDSSCATAATQNDNNSALAVVTTNSSSTVKILKDSIIPYDNNNDIHVTVTDNYLEEEEDEFIGLKMARTEDSTNSGAIATNNSIEFDIMETTDGINDNSSQNSSDIETQQLCDKMMNVNDENNNDSSAMIPVNASEIFSYNDEMEVASSAYDGGLGSICDYRYIKRTKSFIGSEVLSMCGPSSVRNSCSLTIESGGVITAADENTIPFTPRKFRFSSNDYVKGWNFSTPTTEIKEVSEKCLLDNELSDDEQDDDDNDVKFLPIRDDIDDDNNNDTINNAEKRKRAYYPLIALASNNDGCIEAVNFDDDSTSYRVSASVEEMDDYDQQQNTMNTITEEQSTLEYVSLLSFCFLSCFLI